MKFFLRYILLRLRDIDWIAYMVAFLPAFLMLGFLVLAQALGEETGYVLYTLSAIGAIAIAFAVAVKVKKWRGRSIRIHEEYMRREGFKSLRD